MNSKGFIVTTEREETSSNPRCITECTLAETWYWVRICTGFVITFLGLIVIINIACKDHNSVEGSAGRELARCSCQYALGGGAVAPGGSYPQAQIFSVECASALHIYLVQQYDRDVEAAVASARSYFDSYPRQANTSQVIVLDIDETSLSNRAEWLATLERMKTGFNVPSIKINTLVEADNAPPLQPMLNLYTDLYRKGFSVTFITGRRDYGRGREATARNLEAVGYGVACSDAPQQPLRAERAQGMPCYVALGMRSEGDLRLASVYKPDQRAQLQASMHVARDKGYEIVASFGDQWSDLAGTSAAVASFKMPNPFYYIL